MFLSWIIICALYFVLLLCNSLLFFWLVEHKGGTCNLNIKPTNYDGISSWQVYTAGITHFDASAMLGKWRKLEKDCIWLYHWEVKGVLGNFFGDALNDYKFVRALNEKSAPPNQTEPYRAQLSDRKRLLPELEQCIRRFTNLPHPTAPYDARGVLAKEQF